MYSLQSEFDDLMYSIPVKEKMNLPSQRELQDFKERDFDRRLEIIKVQALVHIAERLQHGPYTIEEYVSHVDN